MLERLRRAIRGASLWDGAVRVLLAVFACALVSFLLDYFLRLPGAVRAIVLAGSALALVWVLSTRFLLPLSRRLTDEELAELVEEKHPDLRQALITAVELSRADSFAAQYASADLVASVVRKAEEAASAVDPRRVLSLRGLKRNGLLLGVLTLLVAGGLLARSDLVGIWARRNLLFSSERWPKGTILELEPSTPLVVAIGDDLPISVRIVRGQPASVVVEWETEDGSTRADVAEVRSGASWDLFLNGNEASGEAPDSEAAVRATLTGAGIAETEELLETLAAGRGRLVRDLRAREASELARRLRTLGSKIELASHDLAEHSFRNVSRPLRFWVRGGDDRIGPFDVEVRLRPRIDMQSVEITYRYPYYTGADQVDQVDRHGNLKVPVGTRVRFRMATNVEVDRAFLVLRTGEDAKESARLESAVARAWPDPAAVELTVEDSRRFSGEFVVDASGYYSFELEGRGGFRSAKPERFRIQAIEDQKPSVRILEPRLTEEVSPQARIQVRIEVKDDYAVRAAVLEGTYYPPLSDEPVRISFPLDDFAAETPIGARANPTETTLLVDIARLPTGGAPPAPGSRLEIFALAEDFGSSGRFERDGVGEERGREFGNVGESEVHLLQVVDPKALEQIFVDRTMVIRDVIQQLQAREETIRKSVEEFQDRATVAGKVSSESAKELSRHRQDQHKIGEGIERQMQDLDRIVASMEANQVGDDEWKSWLRRVRERLDDVASTQSPEVVERLESLRRDATESPADPKRLAPITSQQRRIERELDSIAIELSHFGDINTVIQKLRDLRGRQEEIRSATRTILGGETPKEP